MSVACSSYSLLILFIVPIQGVLDDSDADNPGAGPAIMPLLKDDGYVSPDFDLPSESEDDTSPPLKRAKTLDRKDDSRLPAVADPTLEEEEELALQLLRRKR